MIGTSLSHTITAVPPKLIIFDFDGTLVETEALVAQIISSKLAELGRTVSPADIAATLAGVPRAQEVTLLEALATVSLPERFMEEVDVEWREAILAGVAPTAGTVDALTTLRIPFCVASNATRKDLILRMRSAKIFNLIGPRFFSSHDLGLHKPDPAVFLLAAEAMGVQPSECLVIEDSVTGLEAARRAKMRSCAFIGAAHQSERMHSALQSCEPDGFLWRISDLAQILHEAV
ncbi:HAD family hydrolase [Phyllobacterium zundukense]|uniref:HAD-IA family hydrolase n=1 Tax=Phyllobacterium zundukense TaxID=1867719 RepID=A0ACD4CVC6_9HYPH|nr:HAD-IA family hydrolase [Phyllobacterium zundukense]UXN57546.1 HAD-IA family hydrolase [Phyllobacterium zundukense]